MPLFLRRVVSGQSFRRFIELLLLLYPIWWILLSPPFGARPTGVIQASAWQLLVALIAALMATMAAVFSWRAYRVSGEVFLRRLTVAFAAAASADYLQLCEFFDPAREGRLVLLFAYFARFQFAAGLCIALHSLHLPAETPRPFGAGSFWRLTASWIVWSSLVLLALVSAPMAVIKGVCLSINLATLICTAIAILTALRLRHETPVMNALLASLMLLAQVALIMTWAEVYGYHWFFSFMVCISAYLVLGHGLVSEFLVTRAVTGDFSIDRVIRRLIQQKASLEARLAELEKWSGKTALCEAEGVDANGIERLRRRMEAELERRGASGDEVVLLGFAIARWETLFVHHGGETLSALRRGIAERLQRSLRRLDVFASDGQGRFFVLSPDVSLHELDERCALMHRILVEQPFHTGSFALYLDCHVAFVVAGRDGKMASELFAVCNRRLDLEQSQSA